MEIAYADDIVGEISYQQKIFFSFFSFFFVFLSTTLIQLLLMASKSKKNKCVFEKQVVLLLVSTRKVETIGSLISAEKATFQREKCLASL